MEKLTYPPDQESYSVTDGDENITVNLDGGFSRTRKDISGAASIVNVQWSVGPGDYKYLRAFYNGVTFKGVSKFLIDLYMDEFLLTEHQAKFVPKTFRLMSQHGLEFVVGAQLEVMPTIPDYVYDLSYSVVWGTYGEESYVFLNEFEYLVNVKMPSVLV